jgi:phage terminase large subunit GpA-like protein
MMTWPDWMSHELAILEPPADLAPSEWADLHFVTPPDSPKPGPLRLDHTPYLREPLDAYLDDGVDRVTMMTGAQVGKTTMLLILMLYTACERPRPMLYVMPRDADIRMMHMTRIKPAIDASQRVHRELSGRPDDMSVDHGVRFLRCYLRYAASTVPAAIKSSPIALVLGDEIEEWSDTAEGCPISLAQKRTTNYRNAKMYLVSTPGFRGGKTWQQWERSDQREHHVPCVACGSYQVLGWDAVRWDNELPTVEERAADATMHCTHCGVGWSDTERYDMVDSGLWVPQGASVVDGVVEGADPHKGRHRGYRLPSLCSKFVALRQLVYEWLTEDRADFVRQRLASIWDDQIDAVRRDHLECARGDYHMGEVPDDVVLVTAGIDVQGHRLGFFAVVRGWAADGRSWLLRAFNPRTWSTLEEDILHGTYGGHRVAWTFVDSGGTRSEEGRSRTDEVYDFCRQFPRSCAPTKGRQTTASGGLFVVTNPDRSTVTGKVIGGLQLWTLHTTRLKDELAARVAQEREAWQIPIHTAALATYEQHLVSEHKVVAKGRPVWVLRPGVQRNDYWDAEVLALAAWHKMRDAEVEMKTNRVRTPATSALGNPGMRREHGRARAFGRRRR